MNKEIIINKEIAFFWSGGAMSWMRYLTLFSFRKLNPDWKINLFTAPTKVSKKPWKNIDRQDFFCYDGIDYCDKLDVNIEIWDFGVDNTDKWSPVRQCDTFQWQWLAENSGFYADMDILFMSPMSIIPSINFETIFSVKSGHFPVGFLGSSGDNLFFGDIRDKALEFGNDEEYQSCGIKSVNKILWSRTHKLTHMFEEKYPDNVYCNLPTEVVYPYLETAIYEFFFQELVSELPSNCVGVHWYAGSPGSQDHNCKLTEDNFRNGSVFAKLVESIL